MNILFVSDVSISEPNSGAERVLFEQSTILQGRGHNVHILTRKLRGDKSDHEIIQGVNEWRYDVNRSNPFSFIVSTLLNSKRLFELLENQHSFDCINFHQPFSSFGVIRSPASLKIKKIYTCHSLSFEEFQSRNPRPKGVYKKILYFLNTQTRKSIERKAIAQSDKIIVLSDFTSRKLRHVYKMAAENIAIIPGGVDLKRFYPVVDKIKTRRELNIQEDRLILFTLRDLEPRMGLENLVYAMQEVAEKLPEVYLIIGGHGPLREPLSLLRKKLGLEKHIRLAGFISNAKLPDYYSIADIFVLPTLELEGFGLITLEALASGVPVLGTPIGGTVEILSRFDPGYLFESTSSEAMAELIINTCQKFRNDPAFVQDLSLRCRVFVEKNYSWEKNVDSLERMMLEIFKKG